MENVQELFGLILEGALLLLALFVIGWLIAMLILTYQGAKKRLVNLDVALAPFGRTDLGKLIYGQVEALDAKVRDPQNQLILSLVGLVHRVLPVTDNMISAHDVATAFGAVTSGFKYLLDGVPGNIGEVLSEVKDSADAPPG